MSGPVSKPAMIIGQAQKPETRGTPFLKSHLWKWFEKIGWSAEQIMHVFHFDALVGHGTAKGKKGRVPPTKSAISLYRPQLLATIDQMRPKLIVPVGGLALQQVMGLPVELAEMVGQRLVMRPFSAAMAETVVIPLPHPSGVSLWLNSAYNRGLQERALELLATELQLVKTNHN